VLHILYITQIKENSKPSKAKGPLGHLQEV